MVFARVIMVIASTISLHVPTFAASPGYVKDAKSCELNDKTTLRSLCSSGMGVPTYPPTQEMINRSPNIANMIVDSAKKYGVDPKLALAVSAHEGAMSACAGSFSGVQGPMQLTQATGSSYGMNRGILTENIDGGMLTLKAASKSCGGDGNIRCLADKYNGSTESQRRNWTNDVTRRLAGLQTVSNPQGCGGNDMACKKGDFPTTPTGLAATGAGSGSLGTIAPQPAPTDIVVGSGMAMLEPSGLRDDG